MVAEQMRDMIKEELGHGSQQVMGDIQPDL